MSETRTIIMITTTVMVHSADLYNTNSNLKARLTVVTHGTHRSLPTIDDVLGTVLRYYRQILFAHSTSFTAANFTTINQLHTHTR